MTIANELSSDIALALVAAQDKQPEKLNDIKEILLEVHSTLQRLTEQSRRARAQALAARAKQAFGN
jgi:hypothetical protein